MIKQNLWTQNSYGEWEATIPESVIDKYIGQSDSLKWGFFSFDHKKWNTCSLIESEVRTGKKKRTIYKRGFSSLDFHKLILPFLYRKYFDLITPPSVPISDTLADKQVWESIHQYAKFAHGFVPRKSCITQANAHVGYRYTISLDMKDFFESVSVELVKGLIPEDLIPFLFINGVARQGLPSSPMITNIAFHKIDIEINDYLQGLLSKNKKPLELKFDKDPFLIKDPKDFSYSRYADDLTISLNSIEDIDVIISNVCLILEQHLLKINIKKTKVQSYRNGRRIICGVGVDDVGVYPTRKTLKKLRAAKHQKNAPSLIGLYSWISSIE
ncbi:reverse transcriptase domain-containing protein [Vibrio agarivorans]|uniref:reverse transcriptase domain-containing protein n=1 Tax=Vibrio agarivorans TaxID=153622 RepID=UPI0025B4080F|nr:reverse transcriptase domain-containing protein [Vibrio agarivorans]MDN3660864.1 reverse transcriptase domain-containing protein [Vibrio agarivorans]